ncbi:alpha/beta hydrolase family protein [Pseudomonas antarctica]|uniref:alpha/beta hydrolase family protein n=1 Tax=Pseudomonas antarctica TaxID=219572 RepID=UPI00387B3841
MIKDFDVQVHLPPDAQPFLCNGGNHVAWLSSANTAVQLVVYDIHANALKYIAAPRGLIMTNIHPLKHCSGFLIETDTVGNENTSLNLLDQATEAWTCINLSGLHNVKFICQHSTTPNVVVLSAWDENNVKKYYKYDLSTCECRVIELANSRSNKIYFNHACQPVIYEQYTELGGIDYYDLLGKCLLSIPASGDLIVKILECDVTDRTFLCVTAHGKKGSKLLRVPLHDRPAVEEIFVWAKGSIKALVLDEQGTPAFVIIEKQRFFSIALSKKYARILKTIQNVIGRDAVIIAISHGTVFAKTSNLGLRSAYFIFDVLKCQNVIFTPALNSADSRTIINKHLKVIAHDGYPIPIYVSYQRECYETAGTEPLARPTVVLIHGGPWKRVSWEFSDKRDWLMSLGYLVIEPNYRGSLGFGEEHLNQGNLEWGGKMRTDIEDVIRWAIDKQYTDEARIALYGGSYGGFAALNLAVNPIFEYACIIAMSPIVDVNHFLTNIPVTWSDVASMLNRRVAHPGLARGVSSISPAEQIEHIKIPVLMAHGKHDPRLAAKNTVDFFLKVCEINNDATFLFFLNEGHSLARSENKEFFLDQVRIFLNRYMNGYSLNPVVDQPAHCKLYKS